MWFDFSLGIYPFRVVCIVVVLIVLIGMLGFISLERLSGYTKTNYPHPYKEYKVFLENEKRKQEGTLND